MKYKYIKVNDLEIVLKENLTFKHIDLYRSVANDIMREVNSYFANNKVHIKNESHLIEIANSLQAAHLNLAEADTKRWAAVGAFHRLID
ncbi:hypothetical protein EQG49_13305 [Periweissella cryptocerci]|uniref:Uncharacterized protein n=1 Tax=Periweissella cryptocerci TaxID=2506420 RepID=A0A4P6YWZ6_9LACO|nr:hypothetical protein [Periweissella cryptocerci]QBO37374.1 hypothetical protein EQG49_13305 [Periweissella cryptocerci]